ncbi:hypothetical protein CMMCAS08_11095 [Clavibacter michiganensis subsp. michiganensis]|uniref:DUF5677 domain-containing protein n=1 Tax=Clavibacter michiganensis TaxID=28447 RepID=UPI000B72321B|nr:DUF5677 domain-containing protein [Clavibacter michiganensis]OUD90599.1 hypothetical protein CMMCAS05_11330 [Clavibacter michiganensis subsp. michiganensis]OUE03290.1 hypothetical protein CMMCAS08_11095 [Clavibacter michiganensis subsp. michiganensis]OUE11557.1 hypothetical protein CMMCAY01_01005 [Clavibacter michiganensis subsp. michiganensis]UOW03886.1 DUF5677 domain-containing protein [Clavibacter michiganensis subsp. michiganensis]
MTQRNAMPQDQPIAYRSIIAELLAIWEEGIKRPIVSARTDLQDPKVPVLVRGLTAHAVDCARGILTLYKASQPVAALPIVRTLMEDSSTAAWLLVSPSAWKAFISKGARDRRTALNDILQLDPGDIAAGARLAEMEQLLQTLGEPSGYQVQQRMNAVLGAENMYLMYRAASALSHADSPIVDLYTGEDASAILGVGWKSHASLSNASAWIAVAATNLLHALIAWDICQADRPDQLALENIARRLNVRSDFQAR